MTKAQIAEVLSEIATLLELKDENPFKIRAYANAARSIETWGGNLSDLQDEEALAKIPGIGKAIAAKIKELASTGSLKYVEELRAEFPAAILELFSIPGLGAKKIKALYEQLHISSIEQLREACASGRVAKLPGFGETMQEKLCQAIEQRAKPRRFVSIRADRKRSRSASRRSRGPAGRATCRSCRKLPSAKRNCARCRSCCCHKKARADHAIFHQASAGGIAHRAGIDKDECATSFRYPVRPARRQFG